jgi:UDP-N-acetylglucosamine 1-carboxyvinyltransferase
MRAIGIEIDFDPAARRLSMHAKKITSNTLPPEAAVFRASYYIWGALLARFVKTGEFGSLKILAPGGCELGGPGRKDLTQKELVVLGHGASPRATDYHANLMANMFGAELCESADGTLEFILPKKFDPAAAPIYSTTLVSHGTTFHWMLSAATSPNLKMIYNASMEPEVPHLMGILNAQGARIRGTNTTAITNLGFSGKLLSGGEFDILPDRMETGFYALLAMILRSRIKLIGTDARSCRPWLNSVIEIAGKDRCQIFKDFMVFDFRDMGDFDGRSFIISPIPGKETDMQQLWAPVLAGAKTPSFIYDPIWTHRAGHLPELAKFGIKSESRVFEISNAAVSKALEISIFPSKIHAATPPAVGMDLRGTPSLILAAAAAKGRSRIDSPKTALRGYPNLIENLRSIGINVS